MATYSINVGVNAAQAARGIQQLRSSLRNLNATADRSRNILSTLFVVPLFGIFTLQAALVNVISTLAEYSSAMATVRAVSAATILETRQLNKEFQRLGITTKFTATQAAGAGVFLSRAGFTPPQIEKIVEESLDLALATGVSPDRAADIATNVLTAFNLPIDELGKVFDQLAFVANRTNTDLTQLAEALKFIGPSAESADIPLNQVISALGILAQSGLRGSIAGTSLRRVISALASEAPIVAKRLNALGLNFDDVGITAGDLVHTFITLIENGVELGEAFALFGVRGGPGFEAIADRIPHLIQLANETERTTGFVRDLVTIMETSLTFVLTQVKSAFEGIIIAVGELLDTELKKFLSDITDSLRAVAKEADVVVNVLQALALTISTVFGLFLVRLAVPLLGFLTGLTTVGRSLSSVITAIFTPLSGGATRTRVILVALLGILTSILGVIKIVFSVGASLLIAFSSEIKVAYLSLATLQDVLSAIARAVLGQFTDVNALVGETGGIISGLSNKFLDFLRSEDFARGLVTFFDLITRAAIILQNAIQLIFDPVALFTPIIASAQIQLVKLTTAILTPVTNILDFFINSHPFLSINPEDLNTAQLYRNSIAEIERLQDEVNKSIGNTPEFANISDALRNSVLDYQELLRDATNIAVTRSLENYRDRIQLLADQPLERLPLGDEPTRLTADQKRNRLFNVYLENLQLEHSVLQAATRERELQKAILEAQSELGFKLEESERTRLGLIIAQKQEAKAQDDITDVIGGLIDENEALNQNSTMRAKNLFIRELERKVDRDIVGTTREFLLSLYDTNKALKEQDVILERINGPQQQIIRDRVTLHRLYAEGAINVQRLNKELQDLFRIELESALSVRINPLYTYAKDGIEALIPLIHVIGSVFSTIADTVLEPIIQKFKGFIEYMEERFPDVARGIKLGILDIQKEFTNVTSNIRKAVVDTFKGMENAIVEFVRTGKISFNDLVDSILDDLVRIAVRQSITAPLAGALANAFTFAPNTSSGLFSSTPGGLGGPSGASGGQIRGPGSGTSDSISAFLSNGEFVVNAASTRKYLGILQAINSGISIASGNSDTRDSNPEITFQIIDQRSTETPPVETEVSRTSDGRTVVKSTIKDTNKQLIEEGAYDGSMARRYGLRPGLV